MSVEVGGYSGWGLWLILAVLTFNLACIPAWFLVNHLKRNHEFRIKQVRTFLALLAIEPNRPDRADLSRSVALIEQQVEEAEGLGALWGRRHASLAQLGLYQLEHRFPEICDQVRSKMMRGRDPG
jgi:hypothetical protein